MMRRRTAVALLAGVLLAGLVAVPGSPAGAQDLADLPRLGFEIDPTQGFVGDDIDAQVDVDDIQEHCLQWLPPGTEDVPLLLSGIWMEISETVLTGFNLEGPFFWGEERLMDPTGADIADPDFQVYYRTWATFLLGMGIDADVRDIFFNSIFPITFVDPVTQELLGELGGYDPFTGEGSIEVPDLPPTLYAVAAACLFPTSAEDQVMGGELEAGFGAFVEWLDVNYPDRSDIPSFDVQGEAWQQFVSDAAPIWILEVLEIQAVGIDFYCILQDDGFCATPPGPVGLIDDDVIGEFNGNDPLAPGPDAGDLDGLEDAGDLVAVDAAPSFTG